MDRHLIVGLGNPGPSYVNTRHNAGYLVVERLAERVGGKFRAHKSRAIVVEARLGPVPGAPVVLAKPTSFMNLSGGPVNALVNYYDIPPDRLVVVHDELDLPFGTIRLKRGGGGGGHNGLRSLTAALRSPDFLRVRFGIGRPAGRQDPADYVLRPFSAVERRDLDLELGRAADATELVITAGLEAAQNAVHGPTSPQP